MKELFKTHNEQGKFCIAHRTVFENENKVHCFRYELRNPTQGSYLLEFFDLYKKGLFLKACTPYNDECSLVCQNEPDLTLAQWGCCGNFWENNLRNCFNCCQDCFCLASNTFWGLQLLKFRRKIPWDICKIIAKYIEYQCHEIYIYPIFSPKVFLNK